MLTLENCQDFLRTIRSARADLAENQPDIADVQLKAIEARLENTIENFLDFLEEN